MNAPIRSPRKVVRFNLWTSPRFDELLNASPLVALQILDLHAPEEANWQGLADADIYHVSAAKDDVPLHWQVTEALLARCPNLLCVSSSGAGYDTVDVDACTQRGILVVNQSGGNAIAVAEHAFGLILDLKHRITESDIRLKKAASQLKRENLMGHDIHGQTLGLVGLGNIGQRMAKLGDAFGMRVIAHDPYLSDAEARARGAEPVSFDALLAQSDVVSLHCPRNRETLKMFDAATFARMKRGATFISTARGGIHDETALHAALVSNHLAGAGLDVWEVEPPPLDHPLLTLPNVVSTFHTAGVTHEARHNIHTIAAQQILAICAGETAPRVINPEVLPIFAARFARTG